MDTSTAAGRFTGSAVTEQSAGRAATPSSVIDAIGAARIVPVVTIAEAGSAPALATALADGDLPVVEITLRTTAGIEAVRLTRERVPASVVGAGSVMSRRDAEAAIDAGAQFLVSPGLDEGVVASAQHHGVLVIPGIATATELMKATALGVSVVKLFPAAVVGGLELIKALSPVWPGVRFMPTGGVSPENLQGYFRHPQVVAVGGSWMVSQDAVVAGDWAAITVAARAAAQLVGDQS